jgi:hypothetical protein
MSQSPNPSDSVKTVHDYLVNEIQRARMELSPDQWQAILVGVSDGGEIAARPCLLVLPFHYPGTLNELDAPGRHHFNFPKKSWKLRHHAIPEFVEQSEVLAALDDPAQSVDVSDRQRRRRIEVLQEACASVDPALTIFGIESDNESWWEVNTFPISGPRIPSPPAPVSDVQVLARLCRHTHSCVGPSRFHIEGGAITGVAFDGADTTDATIDLLRVVPNLKELLRNLKEMSLQRTLITERSLKYLQKELPHVEVLCSHFLRG